MPGLKRTLWRNARLATLATADGWGWIDPGGLLTEGDRITWAGPMAELPASMPIDAEHDLGGALLTPGLIDAHTHLVYGGDRAAEFEQRLQGLSYEAIARAGGGIRSTVAATRAASDTPRCHSSAAAAYSRAAHFWLAIVPALSVSRHVSPPQLATGCDRSVVRAAA